MGQTHPLGRPTEITVRQQGKVHEICHHIEHGNRYINAGASAATLDKRPQDRRKRGLSGRNVTNGNAYPRGLFAGAVDRADSAFRLNQKVIGFFTGARACGSVTVDLTGNESRVVLPQGITAKTSACQGPRRQVVQKDIRFFQH